MLTECAGTGILHIGKPHDVPENASDDVQKAVDSNVTDQSPRQTVSHSNTEFGISLPRHLQPCSQVRALLLLCFRSWTKQELAFLFAAGEV